MSDLNVVKEKILAVVKHYNSETARILTNGLIDLGFEVYYKPEDDADTDVDASVMTQDDIDVMKTERDVLCPWIGEKVRDFCNVGVDVKVEKDTATSITFRLRASAEYRVL